METSLAREAPFQKPLYWAPEGKHKRGFPKITWRRTVEKDIKETGKTWGGIKLTAKDR